MTATITIRSITKRIKRGIFGMKFNEKIIRLRKIKGITQDELASAVGVSRQAVYKWECGQSYPEVAKLIELKLLFNISIDDLLDDSYEIALPDKKKKKKQPQKARVRVSAQEKDMPEQTEQRAEPAAVTVDVPAAEIEAADTVEEAIAVEEPVAEAPEVKEEPEAKEVLEKKDAEEEKKAGFFGRLFGRK